MEQQVNFMTLQEHVELLEELGREFQKKLSSIDPNDAAAIKTLETEFHEQVLGAGREFEPKVRIILKNGGGVRLTWE